MVDIDSKGYIDGHDLIAISRQAIENRSYELDIDSYSCSQIVLSVIGVDNDGKLEFRE